MLDNLKRLEGVGTNVYSVEEKADKALKNLHYIFFKQGITKTEINKQDIPYIMKMWSMYIKEQKEYNK